MSISSSIPVTITIFYSKYRAKQDYYESVNVGDVVEDVRTVFEMLQDKTIYIPAFSTT